MEPSLPQLLCVNCANMTINSYLFKKLCQHSNEKWLEGINKFKDNLKQSDSIGSNIETVFLMMNQEENLIFTSRKKYPLQDKKAVLTKIKSILKNRNTYKKVKEKNCNIVCDECGERFNSNCNLIKHMHIHSKIRYNCPECPKIFASQVQLTDHAERLHYPKKVQCAKCAKMFGTERMLKYHDKLHHVAAVCKLCFLQFPSKKLLRAHLDTHEAQKCPHCNKSFKNKYSFKFHLEICGKEGTKIPNFYCDICNKGYVRKNGLRTHLKTEHGFGNVLSCNWCGKKYDAISRLRNHIVKHTRERNFHCDQCGNKFVTQAALVYHIRLHTGEKPFKCKLCTESFLSASRRMEHMKRKHLGPTKECPVCNVKFVTGHQLRKHVHRHFDPKSKLYVPEAVNLFSIENSHSKLDEGLCT